MQLPPLPSPARLPLSYLKLFSADCPVPETGCNVYSQSPNPQSRNPQATNHNVAECPKQHHRAFARRVVLVTPRPSTTRPSLLYTLSRGEEGWLFQSLLLDWFAEQAKYKIFSVSIRSICLNDLPNVASPLRAVRDYTGITARQHALVFPRRTPAESRELSRAQSKCFSWPGRRGKSLSPNELDTCPGERQKKVDSRSWKGEIK